MGDTKEASIPTSHVAILKSLKRPLFGHTPGEKWYDYNLGGEKFEVSKLKKESIAERAEELAGQYLKLDVEQYELNQKSKSDSKWLSTVLKEGTQADKISAVQLKVNASPVHALSYLNMMVEVIQKKGLRESANILKVLMELFENDLLPPNRKLVAFNQREFYEIKESVREDKQKDEFFRLAKRLVIWKFESDLKKCYERFVRALESLASTAVEGVADQACKSMATLLTSRKEQEKYLLETLVNKLGHPNHKIGSSVAILLEKLVQKHPNMRPVVIDEVDRLIFRKNISEKAQHYGVHFLSRILLNAGESDLAVKLLKIYFNLFKILIAKDQKNNKILSLTMVGTNRALPYAREKSADLSNEVNSIYNIVHTTDKLQISISALKLLFQLANYNEGLSDRFYSAFYRKLIDIHSTSHDGQLFDLLLKVLKHDTVENRMRAFLKRLFQLALAQAPSFAAATLILCSKLTKERPKFKIWNEAAQRIKADPEKLKKFESDDDEEHYEDVKMDDGSEIGSNIKGLKTPKQESKDVKPEMKENGRENSEEVQGWVHRNAKKSQKHQENNILARNPLFIENCSLEPELILLSRHYHPSVAVFASNILSGRCINEKVMFLGIPINYNGDPLVDFTTMRFLDRFSFKNPKVKEEKSQDPFFKNYQPQGVKKLAPTSKEYISKRIEEIPIDERYLYRFATMKFSQKLEKEQKKKKPKAEEDDFDDAASINSDEFDLIMNRFEPGERNEEFEVDFAQELTQIREPKSKKDKKKSKKQADSDEEMEEDVDMEDLDEEEIEFSGEDSEMDDEASGFSDEEEGGEEEELEDEEDSEMEGLDEVEFGEDSEDERPKKRKSSKPKGFKSRKKQRR